MEIINGVESTSSYIYDDDNRISVVTNGEVAIYYHYDSLGRVDYREITQDDIFVFFEYFYYSAAPSDDPDLSGTSAQISSYRILVGGYDFTYTYDNNGNITSVSDGTYTTSYVYDSANQLIRENNQAGNYTHTWTYDQAGNILNRKEYAYTTGTLGTPTDTVTYTYGDEQWGDLLTAYDGNTITYDGVGNPLSDGEWTYTWENGRQLASMTNGSATWTYAYNADGMRISKTNGSATYHYVYNGSQLSQMTEGNNTLTFTYDASGKPLTVTYNGTTYFYATSIQGDVFAIMDTNAHTVVTYSYDAWGNLLSLTGDMANTLGVLNPLRYRGYVYDTETGLYYLQSRYYDPEIGRFINADAFVTTGQRFTGNNMFAYCGNNPVMNIDYQGFYYACYEDRITTGHGGGGGLPCPPKTKQVDITEKLDTALEENAKAFQDYVDTHSWSASTWYFIRNVQSGGKWDLKYEWNLDPYNTDYIYNGVAFNYDDIGNIHYGYVSRVLYSENFALKAAGTYQIVSGTSSRSYAQWNYDDPADQRAIKIGFLLWDMRNGG